MWLFFHKLGSPRWFYHISGKVLPWLALLSFCLLSCGVVWGLAFAPEDFKQGNSYRIIFIHVPSAFISLAGYYVMAGAAIVAMVWKIKLAEMVMKCCAPIGAGMTFIALITGAIWGKPTWGTYWVWDARITSMLVLFFLYLGVVSLYGAYRNPELAAKAAGILALVGTVNIPIIYKSVDWWFSLHQPASIKLTEAPSMPAEMWQPLLVMIIGFYSLYALLVILHTRAEVLSREQNTKWVTELVAAKQGDT